MWRLWATHLNGSTTLHLLNMPQDRQIGVDSSLQIGPVMFAFWTLVLCEVTVGSEHRWSRYQNRKGC